MIRERADVAILGAGFAGSVLAMVLRRLGRSVVLLSAAPIRASPSANPRRRWPTSCWSRWPRNTTCRAWHRWRSTGRGSAPIHIWFAA